MNKQDLYAQVASRLREYLDRGVLPWRQTWKTGLPINYFSKRFYNGINFLALSMEEFPTPHYLTFLQCNKLNGRVLPGSKGIPVIYWSIKEFIDKEEGQMKKVPLLRISYVFNLSQTTLYKGDAPKPLILSCEEIISCMIDSPEIIYGMGKCAYNPQADKIMLPHIGDFDSPEEYYSTLLHELIHSTGHPKRLNRFTGKRTGESYSREELIAEIGSSYLCALGGISNSVIENQAAYIQGWLKAIDEAPDALISASAEAARAVNYIMEGPGDSM